MQSQRMTPEEAARRMGMPPNTLRMFLRLGKYPFGVAGKREGSSRWTYYINRSKFEEWADTQKGERNDNHY